MKARWKKAVGVTATLLTLTFAVFVVVTLVFALVVRFRGGSGVFGYGFYQIVSGSMEPEIAVGDVVVAKKASIDLVEPGDNVVFRYQGKLVTHKLVKKEGGMLTTQGLANHVTETFPASDLVAVQVGLLPKFGYVLDFIRTPYGFVLLIAVPLGGVLVWQTVSLTKQLRAAKNADRTAVEDEIKALKNRLEQAGGALESKTPAPRAKQKEGVESEPIVTNPAQPQEERK